MSDYASTPVITMPTRDGGAVLRPLSFENLTAKARWLDAMASLDATQPIVRSVAARIARSRGANDDCGIVRDIQMFVINIPYSFGAGHQRFFAPAELLDSTPGTEVGANCADKARLFVALCRSVELEARIVPIFTSPTEFVHVMAQARCHGSDRNPLSEDGGWLRVETIVRGVPLGMGPSAGQHDAAGRLVLS
jgi:transglutaminase-like putative cysteine protease